MSRGLVVSAADVEMNSFELVTLLDIAFALVEENQQIEEIDKEQILTLLNVAHERGERLKKLPCVPMDANAAVSK